MNEEVVEFLKENMKKMRKKKKVPLRGMKSGVFRGGHGKMEMYGNQSKKRVNSGDSFRRLEMTHQMRF